jgi:putative transposase
MAGVFTTLKQLKDGCLEALSSRLTRWTKPLGASLPLATLTDLGRSKSELLAENALLRQHLIILRRQVKRPPFTRTDRILLVLLARLVRTWQQALLIVQPDTLLRWHRELFRLVWKRKSKTASHTPKVAAQTIALIRQIATENRLWGAERIRGELLKLANHARKFGPYFNIYHVFHCKHGIIHMFPTKLSIESACLCACEHTCVEQSCLRRFASYY